jgi:hypothetical protein
VGEAEEDISPDDGGDAEGEAGGDGGEDGAQEDDGRTCAAGEGIIPARNRIRYVRQSCTVPLVAKLQQV